MNMDGRVTIDLGSGFNHVANIVSDYHAHKSRPIIRPRIISILAPAGIFMYAYFTGAPFIKVTRENAVYSLDIFSYRAMVIDVADRLQK